MSTTAAPRARTRPATRATAVAADEKARVVRLLDHPLANYYIVLAAAALLLVLGLVMVLSASSVDSLRESGSSFTIFRKQAVWFAIGLPLLFIATRMSVRAWRALAYPALAVSVGLLALVPVLGTAVNGNKNWLMFGGLSIQPSEAAKLALVVWGADLLARKDSMHLLGDTKHVLVPLVPVATVIIGLVLVGDDLGTAMVLMMILLSLLYFAGTPMRVFVAFGGVVTLLVAYIASTNATRIARLTDFFHHSAGDPLGTGYQAMQAKLAFASGGWWGVGLGASRQKWGLLPQAQNDTIFAIIGEELGFVGAIVVLLLFGALAYGGLRIALRSNDTFVRLAAAGAVTWISFQFIVNVGAVLGLLPIIGLPLPLISYGGSALVPTMLAIGMLLSFARNEPAARAALRARRGKGGTAQLLRRLRRPRTA